MRRMTGTIIVVQEGRFRLRTPDGRSELFILAHDAPVEPQDLPSLVHAGMRLTVHYSTAPGRIAGLAHDLVEAKRGA